MSSKGQRMPKMFQTEPFCEGVSICACEVSGKTVDDGKDVMKTNQYIRPLNVSDNDNESSDSDNYCYSVNNTKAQNSYTKLKINNRDVKFTVDTGSSINIIDQQTFEQLGHYTLSKTNIKAYAFNPNVPVKMNGKFTTIVVSRRKITVTTIYVTKASGGCLLSGSTAEELGLISLHLNA
ncbi:Transposon Ty3-I Gag-Pol poly, partial [Paramuricea clavata]